MSLGFSSFRNPFSETVLNQTLNFYL
jgi:hypothetical protein